MKTKLIPALLAAATLTSAIAQSNAGAAPKADNTSSSSSAVSSGAGYGSSGARARPGGGTGLAGQNTYGGAGGSTARYRTRLDTIVRRGGNPGPGSIILSSALPPEKFDELTEDLNVLSLLINRNLDRVFGEKATEYRLGVPITMGANRSVETTYLQDFGVLVRIYVPFPVATSGEREKKPEPAAAAPDTEWEKARRALYAGDTDPAGNIPGMPGAEAGAAAAPGYDQKLIDEVKKEILDALKNVANVRHMGAQESATVAIIGAADQTGVAIDPLTGVASSPNGNRPTVMTIRIRKSDTAATPGVDATEHLTKNAKIATYFGAAAPAGSVAGFGAGAMLYGGDYGYVNRPAQR
jgi:hypothetical protein